MGLGKYKEKNMTKEYYNKNAKAFIDNTINADMNKQHKDFEKYLKPNSKILDIGFGSGRDSLYFSRKYEVVSIDNSEVFVEEGKKILNNKILLVDINQMDFNKEFDAIWANAVLLHIPYKQLPDILNKCHNALKENGIMYMSFKYGDFEGQRNGRYFTDLDEIKLNDLLSKTSFNLLDKYITEDVRPDRDEKWLNIIVKE